VYSALRVGFQPVQDPSRPQVISPPSARSPALHVSGSVAQSWNPVPDAVSPAPQPATAARTAAALRAAAGRRYRNIALLKARAARHGRFAWL
jgi:hypothetical protein